MGQQLPESPSLREGNSWAPFTLHLASQRRSLGLVVAGHPTSN
jgi:hypothetical protein